MFKAVRYLATVIMAGIVFSGAVRGETAGELLQKGLYQEEIQGDLGGAVKIYQQAAEDASAPAEVAAQALYRLGACYVKLQNQPQAQAALAELLKRYPEQTALAAKAQALLDEMVSIDPAALMPPGAILYAELGSPGQQIETILNMLQGTPLANPLAVMGGGGGNGNQNPANMMAALLNPSMITEFKKIRGMAVGIYGLENNMAIVCYLFPGKSDALRGILLAVLGAQGRPIEPIEGMQSFVLRDNVAVAHDNDVIIVTMNNSKSPDRLGWCVRQYKGANEPSLLSENMSFARIDRQGRINSAVTVWADVDEGFKLMVQNPNMMTRDVRMADVVVDFANINDALGTLRIRPSEFGVEAAVNFKEGHHCLAYNLVHTPGLRREGFEAIPAEALGLVSAALSEQSEEQVGKAQQAVRAITGLDVGREIFDNIEQVTLFAMPPMAKSRSGVLAQEVSPIVNCLGLSITSRNAAQTKQILTQVLTTAAAINGNQSETTENVQQAASEGRFLISKFKDEPVWCYLDQAGRHTVLSLDREIVSRCVATVNGQPSVLAGGPMSKALEGDLAGANKIVLVSAAGAIRLADSHMHRRIDPADLPADEVLPYSELLGKMADRCEKTGAYLITNEEQNMLCAKVGVRELPIFSEMFPLVMQMNKMKAGRNLRVRAIEPSPADGAKVNAGAPLELKWSAGLGAASHKIYWGTDKDNLVLLTEVKKELFNELPLLTAETEYYWRVDEVQADGAVKLPGIVWRLTAKLDEKAGENQESANVAGSPYPAVGAKRSTGGEVLLRWSAAKGAAGHKVYFGENEGNMTLLAEVDNQATGTKAGPLGKEGIWYWRVDEVFADGRVETGPVWNFSTNTLIGWWKLDESSGNTVSDSSGNGLSGVLRKGAKWRPGEGRIGGALGLSGVCEYAALPELNIKTNTITFTAWIKRDGNQDAWDGLIFVRGDKTAGTGLNFTGTTNELGYTWENEDWSWNWHSGLIVPEGKWVLVALAVGPDKATIYMVDDGKVISASNTQKHNTVRFAERMAIGQDKVEGWGPRNFRGLIDDVRIYGSTLGEGDVKALYDQVNNPAGAGQ